ncbi:MAG TPA: alanine racemase [Gemmatimonadales bacterium]|nr:alanine racemase [Gemmatimonadales bacterium]
MTSIPQETARVWARIDLRALVHNARTVADRSGARLLPMVKANGYGLGALEVARALEALDPWGFGVATVEEGAELRRGGITRPVVVFTPLQPSHLSRYQAHALRPVIGDIEGLEAWLAAGAAPFHVEVDTGMARVGFRWQGENGWRSRLEAAEGWEGIFTHFHSADTDPASVHRQWKRFQQVLDSLGRRPALVHAANSAAALAGRTYAGDLVRPGIFLYGGNAGTMVASPVVRLEARVVALRTVRAGDSVSYGATWTAPRDTTIATVAAGYADGVHRSLSNTGMVELNGRVYPIAGRVTMDFLMVAVDGPVALGDVATIYGGLVSLDDQARHAGTISYELLTSLGARVLRRYDHS